MTTTTPVIGGVRVGNDEFLVLDDCRCELTDPLQRVHVSINGSMIELDAAGLRKARMVLARADEILQLRIDRALRSKNLDLFDAK